MATTMVQRSGLVARWVTVTDISGRERTELRWVPEPAADEHLPQVAARVA